MLTPGSFKERNSVVPALDGTLPIGVQDLGRCSLPGASRGVSPGAKGRGRGYSSDEPDDPASEGSWKPEFDDSNRGSRRIGEQSDNQSGDPASNPRKESAERDPPSKHRHPAYRGNEGLHASQCRISPATAGACSPGTGEVTAELEPHATIHWFEFRPAGPDGPKRIALSPPAPGPVGTTAQSPDLQGFLTHSPWPSAVCGQRRQTRVCTSLIRHTGSLPARLQSGKAGSPFRRQGRISRSYAGLQHHFECRRIYASLMAPREPEVIRDWSCRGRALVPPRRPDSRLPTASNCLRQELSGKRGAEGAVL